MGVASISSNRNRCRCLFFFLYWFALKVCFFDVFFVCKTQLNHLLYNGWKENHIEGLFPSSDFIILQILDCIVYVSCSRWFRVFDMWLFSASGFCLLGLYYMNKLEIWRFPRPHFFFLFKWIEFYSSVPPLNLDPKDKHKTSCTVCGLNLVLRVLIVRGRTPVNPDLLVEWHYLSLATRCCAVATKLYQPDCDPACHCSKFGTGASVPSQPRLAWFHCLISLRAICSITCSQVFINNIFQPLNQKQMKYKKSSF